MLGKMMNIVKVVRFVNWVIGGQCTSWAVYQNLKNTYSKASVYRYLLKAESLGLIENESENKYYDWRLTKKGKDLYDEQKQLPF